MFEATLGFRFSNPDRILLKTERVELGRKMELWKVRSSGHEIHLRESDKITYLIPTRGRLDVATRNTGYRAESGEALLFSPNERHTRVSPSPCGMDYEALVVLLSADNAERIMPNGKALRQDLAMSLAADCDKGASLRSYTTFLGEELERQMSVLVRQHVLKGAVVLLEDLFVALLDDESPDARRQSAGTDYVRRAEELMRARFSEAISMKEIADSLNIGLRSLQMAFRQHRALAPREILNRIRLEEVRRRLLEAEPGENVTQIAFDCGFTHLGRFSAIYRRTFGERPSDTLR